MATRQTRLYFNTGFEPGNVPDSPGLLNNCSYLDLEAHWSYQDYYLASLDVKATYDQIKNADYLKYGNGYYYVVGSRMANENTATLILEPDDLTTCGGPLALNYNGGIVQQAHDRSDDYLRNTIDPGIGCSQILRARVRTQDVSINGWNIVASTLDLSTYPAKSANSVHNAYVFKTDVGITPDEDAKVIVPVSGLPLAKPTNIGSGEMTTAGFGYYNADNVTVKANIKFLRDLGIEGAILYTYMVPKQAVTHGDYGHISKISVAGPSSSSNLSTSITSDYSGGYRNKKTYTTYSKYTLQSILSGDSVNFDVGDIADGTSINFSTFMDGQYGGRLYCFPSYFKGNRASSNNLTNISRGVKSLPWKDYPIAFDTMSGSRYAANEYAMAKGDYDRAGYGEIWKGITAGAGATDSFGKGGLKDPAGLISGLGSFLRETGLGVMGNVSGMVDTLGGNMAGNLNTRMYNLSKARAEYAQKQIIAPDLTCSPALGLQNVVAQQFALYHLFPTDRDLERIDNYYTQYGYPQGNCTFDKSMLSGRREFNYIQVSDIEIVRGGGAANVGIGVRRGAEAQLAAGVRIWHTLPHTVTSNPIV